MEFDFGGVIGADEGYSSQRLALFIPNKNKDGVPLTDAEKWVREARELLSQIGGGATAYPPADGNWVDEVGRTVWEQTRIIFCYVYPDRLMGKSGQLREFLHRFGRETNQGGRGIRRPLLANQAIRRTSKRMTMDKQIDITGKALDRLEVTGAALPRIEPAEFAAALGARPADSRHSRRLDLISLGELGSQLLTRLHTTDDKRRPCNLPLSSEEVAALEKIIGAIIDDHLKPLREEVQRLRSELHALSEGR